MDRYLQETPMLDYAHPALQQLLQERGWRALPPFEGGSTARRSPPARPLPIATWGGT